ncbi:chromate transporter [Clostridium sp. BJN0001]|uniref:chromate transporter n=1 Tax=Clostridium sp. BJN0001 TaxID=2930219 RepID=UPI001FD08C9F|nr:chromate transporter [Clostridium sp. BJN0001]
MKCLLDLFIVFMRIGAFTFGGGYAMLPILQKEVVDNKHWVTEEELMDYYAIGQCTPGVIAVNTATFIGYKKKGVLGAIAATLGVIFPSIIIIIVIAAFLKNFTKYTIVKDAFAGIRVCVCVLILKAIIKLGKKSIVDKMSLIIFITILLLAILTNISTSILVVLAGLLGILIKQIEKVINK